MTMFGMSELEVTNDSNHGGVPGQQAPGHDEPSVEPEVRANPIAMQVEEQVTELGEETVGNVRCENPFMVAEDVNVHYGDNHAIRNVTLEIGKKEVIALIGPSGCGKSTFLRCLNRMNDSIDIARVTGKNK